MVSFFYMTMGVGGVQVKNEFFAVSKSTSSVLSGTLYRTQISFLVVKWWLVKVARVSWKYRKSPFIKKRLCDTLVKLPINAYVKTGWNSVKWYIETDHRLFNRLMEMQLHLLTPDKKEN